jgi:putative transposase
LVSIDLFSVPTITMRVLFVFIVLEHRRREVLHFNVTEHPTAAWTSQQIVEAFADRDAPWYLIRDRDSIYGDDVRLRISSMGIEEVLTAPQSPWQNPYAERLIGSIRRAINHLTQRPFFCTVEVWKRPARSPKPSDAIPIPEPV